MNNKNNRLERRLLFLVFIFVFVHFFKDITQDILRIKSPLDVFGDVKEDISFLPSFAQQFFYYGLGGLSFIAEAFLLVAIPKFLWIKRSAGLKRYILAAIIYLMLFLATCTLLDPRLNLLKSNFSISQSIIELAQERPNCELKSNQLANQPINLLTNFAFLISSYLVFLLIKKNKIKDKGIYCLFIVSILIGLGSISHHAFPNNFTLLLDGLPIYIFLFLGLYQLIDLLLGNELKAALLSFIYVLMNFFAPMVIRVPFDPNTITPILNIVLLLLMAFLLYRKFGRKTNPLFLSIGFYALATVFFLLDEKICRQFPLGTHFLWHIFNAATIYYLVKYLVLVR